MGALRGRGGAPRQAIEQAVPQERRQHQREVAVAVGRRIGVPLERLEQDGGSRPRQAGDVDRPVDAAPSDLRREQARLQIAEPDELIAVALGTVLVVMNLGQLWLARHYVDALWKRDWELRQMLVSMQQLEDELANKRTLLPQQLAESSLELEHSALGSTNPTK
jgi:hypothetical protein